MFETTEMLRINDVQQSTSHAAGDRVASVLPESAQLVGGAHKHRTAAGERDAHHVAICARCIHHSLEDWALAETHIRRRVFRCHYRTEILRVLETVFYSNI